MSRLSKEDRAKLRSRAESVPETDPDYDIALGDLQMLDECDALERERDEARESLRDMHRRAQQAEAIARQKLEQLRNEGQRNLGRGLANWAGATYLRERDEARQIAEEYRDQHPFEPPGKNPLPWEGSLSPQEGQPMPEATEETETPENGSQELSGGKE